MKVPSLLIRGCGLAVLLWAALWAGPVAAAECTSITVGNWNVPGTWNCGIVPDVDDNVIIDEDVTLTDSASANNLTINSGSTLTGTNNKVLSVFGHWANAGGSFVHNGMDVHLTGSGTQQISGATTFDYLKLDGVGSTKDFTSSQITIQNDFIHSAGTMEGGTSTFIFKDSDIGGSRTKNFHHLVIDGPVVHTGSNISVSGDFTVSSSGSLGKLGTRTFSFSGTSPQTFSIATGGSVVFHALRVESNAVVTFPNLGTPQPEAVSVTNNGVIRQSGSASGPTEFVYIRNDVDEILYQGLDLAPTSGSINATVVVAGNKAVCNDPNGGFYRNRCFGVTSNTAVSTNVTLYTLPTEDDIENDAFFQHAGGNTWTNRASCASPTNTGNSCSATVTLNAGNNAFLIGSSVNPPTPVTLTHFTLTRQDLANHLAWETATEINFAGFYVQRRPADGDFTRVSDFLYAQGSPLSGASYAWTDPASEGGPYTYRLEAIDFDQSVEFFEPTTGAEEATPNAAYFIYLPLSLR